MGVFFKFPAKEVEANQRASVPLGKGNIGQNSGMLGQGLGRRKLYEEGPPEIFRESYIFCEMVQQKISTIDINKKQINSNVFLFFKKNH